MYAMFDGSILDITMSAKREDGISNQSLRRLYIILYTHPRSHNKPRFSRVLIIIHMQKQNEKRSPNHMLQRCLIEEKRIEI